MKNNKRGISLIVLIVTIIVIIILAAVVILTLSKNNPVESARKARFMEDVRSFQDELALSVSKDYVTKKENRNEKFNATEFDKIKEYIPSFTKDYEKKLYVKDDELMYVEDEITENEKNWLDELGIVTTATVPKEWKEFIASVTEDGVPIPKGFTYVEGIKETGTVIKDENDNEFVWIPVDDVNNYKKDFNFPSIYSETENGITCDGKLPEGIEDETADVAKYGGFYIGRYEAGTPDGTENTKNDKEGIPVSKEGIVVWTNISYTNAKSSAEQMIRSESVQTGLLTGRAWDTTCYFIEDDITKITDDSSLLDSRYYGNYNDSQFPANVKGYGEKQKTGYSDKWKVKNIYDLAGNVYEWTNEVKGDTSYSNYPAYRGGWYNISGKNRSVSFRNNDGAASGSAVIGFRVRLYIKTN